MKFIGDRVSVKDSKDQFSVVITGVGERWEKALLTIWSVIWLCVGLYFMKEFTNSIDRNFKLFILVFLCFWGFYFYKALQILFWRIAGYHSIRIIEDKLVFRAFNGLKAKEKTFFVHNIEKLEVLNVKDRSLNRAYYGGFWVKGLKMLSFVHKGKKTDFAPQISTLEARALSQLLSKKIVKARKVFD